MKATHELTITEAEFKEAILTFINKHDGKSTWKNLKGFTLVNGAHESPICITDIKFKAEMV